MDRLSSQNYSDLIGLPELFARAEVESTPKKTTTPQKETTTAETSELESISAHFAELHVAGREAEAKQEREAENVLSNALTYGQLERQQETRVSATNNEVKDRLVALAKYFNRYNLHLFADFQNLKVSQVSQLAALDLFTDIYTKIHSQLGRLEVSEVLLNHRALNCVYNIFKQMLDAKPDLFVAYHVEKRELLRFKLYNNIEESFNQLLEFLPEKTRAEYQKHLRVIVSFFAVNSCNSFISKYSSETKPPNKKTVSDFLTKCAFRTTTTITQLTTFLKNRYSADFVGFQEDIERIKGALHQLKSTQEGQAVVVNLSFMAKTITYAKENGSKIEHNEEYQETLSLIRKTEKFPSLIKECTATLRTDYLSGLQDNPVRTFLSLLREQQKYLSAVGAYHSKMPVSFKTIFSDIFKKILGDFDEHLQQFKTGERFDKEKEPGYAIDKAAYEHRAFFAKAHQHISDFFSKSAAVTSLSCDLFSPIFYTLVHSVVPDWRDTLDFDSATDLDTAMISEADEKQQVAEPPSIAKPRKPKKYQTKSQKTQSSTRGAHQNLRGIELPQISSAIQLFSSLKTKATSTHAPTTRAEKAKANQASSLRHLTEALDILQYQQCYDASGNLNLLGKTIMCFGALHASLACEQQTSEILFAADPQAIVPHDQAIHAEWLGLNAKHPFITLLGRETLTYRFPTPEEVARTELVQTWPQWLGHVANKFTGTESQQEKIALARLTDAIPTVLSSTQVEALGQIELNLSSLKEKVLQLTTSQEEQQRALIRIGAHLDKIRGFVQGITLMGQQRTLALLSTGIFFGLQTLVEHTWIFALSKSGLQGIVHKRINDLHNISKHFNDLEIGSFLTEAEKTTIRLLDVRKAFEYLPGYCAGRKVVEKLPQMLIDLQALADGAADAKSIWPIKGKPGFNTDEAVLGKLTASVDQVLMLITTVCKMIQQDVLGERPQ